MVDGPHERADGSSRPQPPPRCPGEAGGPGQLRRAATRLMRSLRRCPPPPSGRPALAASATRKRTPAGGGPMRGGTVSSFLAPSRRLLVDGGRGEPRDDHRDGDDLPPLRRRRVVRPGVGGELPDAEDLGLPCDVGEQERESLGRCLNLQLDRHLGVRPFPHGRQSADRRHPGVRPLGKGLEEPLEENARRRGGLPDKEPVLPLLQLLELQEQLLVDPLLALADRLVASDRGEPRGDGFAVPLVLRTGRQDTPLRGGEPGHAQEARRHERPLPEGKGVEARRERLEGVHLAPPGAGGTAGGGTYSPRILYRSMLSACRVIGAANSTERKRPSRVRAGKISEAEEESPSRSTFGPSTRSDRIHDPPGSRSVSSFRIRSVSPEVDISSRRTASLAWTPSRSAMVSSYASA